MAKFKCSREAQIYHTLQRGMDISMDPQQITGSLTTVKQNSEIRVVLGYFKNVLTHSLQLKNQYATKLHNYLMVSSETIVAALLTNLSLCDYCNYVVFCSSEV